MSPETHLSLKAFWEAVEKRLAKYSADELRTILRAMATATLPADRKAFLDELKPAKQNVAAAQEALRQNELLADIDDLIAQIKNAKHQAEEWEDRSERYGRGYYGEWGEDDEEDGLGPYEQFLEPLAALFDRAGAAFDYGNAALARDAYAKLFAEALQIEDDYGRGVRAADLTGIAISEARARYLRAVYETEPAAQRPVALLEAMRHIRTWLAMSTYPMFDDLIQVSPKPLPDQERFLDDWIALLRKQKGGDADAWLREAIRFSRGTAGLAELARAEGRKRPRAYLDWFAVLEQENKHREILSAAQVALKALPRSLPIRAAVADYLCAAAVRLDETKALRAGRWMAFQVKPTLVRLLDLWDVTPANSNRLKIMARAAQHLQAYLTRSDKRQAPFMPREHADDLEEPAWVDHSVLAHAYLLGGNWGAARALATREHSLGWSGSENAQGLVTTFFLVLLSGPAPGALSTNMAQLWQERVQASLPFDSWLEEATGEVRLSVRLAHSYTEQFPHMSMSPREQVTVLAWCLKVANKRVDAIVGGQHRQSYDKAARLAATCAETLRARGDAQEAESFLEDARNRFPRHHAFLRELDAATRR